MNAASVPATAKSIQPKARGVRINFLSVTTVSHAMNLAMIYAMAAARPPTRAGCNAPFIFGTPLEVALHKAKPRRGQQGDGSRHAQRPPCPILRRAERALTFSRALLRAPARLAGAFSRER